MNRDGLWIEREGSGPPLVMLHGWGLNLRVFDALAAALAREFEVIRIDLPGHGRSEEPASLVAAGWSHAEVAELLLAAMPPHAHLLGWSLGAQFALEVAARAPERVASLVLVSATPRFAAADDWPVGGSADVLGGFASQLRADWRGTVRDFLDLQVRGSRNAGEALAELQRALTDQGECAPDVLARSLALLHAADLRGQLPVIPTPALVVAGQYDRVVHPLASQALAAALPSGDFVELPRCGHAPFLSHPAEFSASVRGFLQRNAESGVRT
jgi:pimeloyl-[acyl-carrier protein] methyl ester esterase